MNYRNIVFNYLGVTKLGGSTTTVTRNGVTTTTKSKSHYTFTGKNMNFSKKMFLLVCVIITIVSMAFNYSYEFFKFDDLNTLLPIERTSIFPFNYLLYIFAVLFVLYKRKSIYKKLEPITRVMNIYSRDLPSKLRPAHMRLLVNDGVVDEVSIASTLIDLVDKGFLEYYSVDSNNIDKLMFFHDDSSKLVKKNKNQDGLLKYEKFLIDWFIDLYGNGIEVSSKEVNYGLKNKIINNMEASDMFNEFQALVFMSFPVQNYFTKVETKKFRKLYIAMLIMGMIGAITFVGPILFIIGFGMLTLASPNMILTQLGVDEISEWNSLKKFLVDFGDMQNKTAEMIAVWDYYLTYSIALNISQKATSEINNFFGDNIYFGVIGDRQIKDLNKKQDPFAGFVRQNTPLVENKPYITIEQLKFEIDEEYKKL